MRTAKQDIALLGEAGVWESDRDVLMNAVILLCMHAKMRHRPVRNLHKLAKAAESGDVAGVEKYYDRLAEEVATTLEKYPDIAATLETLINLSDEALATIDRLMDDSTAGHPQA